MLQDAAKRIEYTAKQAPTSVEDRWNLYAITEALARALGRRDLIAVLDRWTDESPPEPAWLVDLVRPLGHTPFDPLIPWAFMRLRKAGTGASRLAYRLSRESPDLLAWFLAKKPDLGKIGLSNALDDAAEYMATEAAKVVYEFPDGWTVRRLETERELRVEGDRMEHCVGGYCEQVAAGDSIIYSLRDPDSQPHVTMEYRPDEPEGRRFTQIFGPKNKPIEPRMIPYVAEFITRVHGGGLMDLIRAGVPAGEVLAARGARGFNLRGLDLSGLDLSNQNLTNMDFSGAVLRDTKFKDALLVGSKWVMAIARGAEFQGADLRGANFTRADLHNVYFTRADGRGAVFDRTNLLVANLEGGDFEGASFAGATMRSIDASEVKFIGADLHNADMRNAFLSEARFDGANLRGIKARDAHFDKAILRDADLTGADLEQANLREATLPSATLVEARLTEANLAMAYCRNADFTGAALDGADLRGADLRDANFTNASLYKADIESANLTNAILTGTYMPDGSRNP